MVHVPADVAGRAGAGGVSGAGATRGAWRVRAFQAGVMLARWLPEPLADLLCRLAGWTGYLLAAQARNNVLANLSHVLPRAGEPELRRLAKRVFYHVARNYYDLLRLRWLSDADLGRQFRIEGRAHLDAALARGTSVIVVTAHLGNFSAAPQYAATLGLPATVVMEPLEPPALYALVAGLRAGRGVRVIPAGPGGLRPLLAALRRREHLVLAGDRDVTGAGVTVPFFGWPARLPSGPAALAQRTGAVLLPMYTVRVGRDRSVVRVLPPVEPPARGDAAGILATTSQLVRALETAIRTAPDQWAVLQSIWADAETSGRLRWG
jgi:KDO2-lipid IV(A) lauroyltransferase